MKNDVLIIYGSLNSVPSPEGAAPAKVIYETIAALDNSKFKVLSNANPKLASFSYDRKTFLHVKPNFIDTIVLFILKLIFPYKKRKQKFTTSSDDQLRYFIAVCRFLYFKNYHKIIVHVSVGLVSMIKMFMPKREVVFYHHGTSLHSKYDEQQWKNLITNTRAIFGVNKVAFKKANERFENQLDASRYFGIPNAITPKVTIEEAVQNYRTRTVDSNMFVFAFSGRICIEKGVLNLLEAFQKVHAKNKHTHLIIFGAAGTRAVHDTKTDYLKTCHDFVASNNLPVNFAGFLKNDDLLKAISEVDVVISSTDTKYYQEGMPLSLLEAISLGKPIIATDSGGNAEVVQDGKNGILISSHPYVEELADAMLKVASNKELYAKLSNAAYESYIENHSYESYTTTFLKALKSIDFFDDNN